MIAAFAVVRGDQRRASSGRDEREDRVRIIPSVIRKVDARQVLRQDAAPEHVHGDVRSMNDTVGICECGGVRHLSLVRAIVGGQGPNVIRPAGMPQLEYAVGNALTMTVEEPAANREARAR